MVARGPQPAAKNAGHFPALRAEVFVAVGGTSHWGIPDALGRAAGFRLQIAFVPVPCTLFPVLCLSMSLFRTKPLATLFAQIEEKGGLKRTLRWPGLIALGIGAIIGAGLFARTPAAAAQNAGPGVIFSFVIAAIGCAFAGLCYAEFAAMIPVAGSAYTYAYVTMGELVAWIIGWALILEYGLGAATLSIYWTEYFNNIFPNLIPWAWRHSPLQTGPGGIHGIINAPALIILLIMTLLLIKGISESATVNAVIVGIKVTIVIMIIAIGWHFISPANHTPFVLAQDATHTGMFPPRLGRSARRRRRGLLRLHRVSTPFPPPRRKPSIPAKTCPSAFSARSPSAPCSTSCSAGCSPASLRRSTSWIRAKARKPRFPTRSKPTCTATGGSRRWSRSPSLPDFRR